MNLICGLAQEVVYWVAGKWVTGEEKGFSADSWDPILDVYPGIVLRSHAWF
jgi:hypothetical protein